MPRKLLLLALGSLIAAVPAVLAAESQTMVMTGSTSDNCALLAAKGADGTYHFERAVPAVDMGDIEFNSRRDDPRGDGSRAALTVPVALPEPGTPLRSGDPWGVHLHFGFDWARDAAFAAEPSHVNLHWRLTAVVKGADVATASGTTTLETAATHEPLDLPPSRTWDVTLRPMAAFEDARMADAALRLEFWVAEPTYPVPVGSTGEASLKIPVDHTLGESRRYDGIALVFTAPSACGDLTHEGRSTGPRLSESTECDGSTCRRMHSHSDRGLSISGSSVPHEHEPTGPSDVPRQMTASSPEPLQDWRPWVVTGSIGIAGVTAFRSRRPA